MTGREWDWGGGRNVTFGIRYAIMSIPDKYWNEMLYIPIPYSLFPDTMESEKR